jgi:hypothetical protein
MKPEIGVCSEMTNTILRQEAEIKVLQRDLIEAQHQNVHLRETVKRLEAEVIQLTMSTKHFLK